MSEKRLQEFKSVQKKDFREAIIKRALNSIQKRREALFQKFRAENLGNPEDTPMRDIEIASSGNLSGAKILKQYFEEEKDNLPPLTDEEIDEMRKEIDEFIEQECPEELDYTIFSLYMHENLPICPYCSSVLTYAFNMLFCPKENCFKLNLYIPATHIADTAWNLKIQNDHHK